METDLTELPMEAQPKILKAAYKHLNIFMEITNNSKIYHWIHIVINLYCNK